MTGASRFAVALGRQLAAARDRKGAEESALSGQLPEDAPLSWGSQDLTLAGVGGPATAPSIPNASLFEGQGLPPLDSVMPEGEAYAPNPQDALRAQILGGFSPAARDYGAARGYLQSADDLRSHPTPLPVVPHATINDREGLALILGTLFGQGTQVGSAVWHAAQERGKLEAEALFRRYQQEEAQRQARIQGLQSRAKLEYDATNDQADALDQASKDNLSGAKAVLGSLDANARTETTQKGLTERLHETLDARQLRDLSKAAERGWEQVVKANSTRQVPLTAEEWAAERSRYVGGLDKRLGYDENDFSIAGLDHQSTNAFRAANDAEYKGASVKDKAEARRQVWAKMSQQDRQFLANLKWKIEQGRATRAETERFHRELTRVSDGRLQLGYDTLDEAVRSHLVNEDISLGKANGTYTGAPKAGADPGKALAKEAADAHTQAVVAQQQRDDLAARLSQEAGHPLSLKELRESTGTLADGKTTWAMLDERVGAKVIVRNKAKEQAAQLRRAAGYGADGTPPKPSPVSGQITGSGVVPGAPTRPMPVQFSGGFQPPSVPPRSSTGSMPQPHVGNIVWQGRKLGGLVGLTKEGAVYELPGGGTIALAPGQYPVAGKASSAPSPKKSPPKNPKKVQTRGNSFKP